MLVAEDEPVIAMDVAWAVEEAGGCVLGPASSVRQALKLLSDNGVCAAILDVDLLDGDIGPVVEELMRRAVPVIIHSGAGLPPALLDRFQGVEVHRKPTPVDLLVRSVAGRLGQ